MNGLLSDAQKQSLFSDLGLDGLPEEKKQQLAESMVDGVLDRIFLRVKEVLTEQDLQTLEDLNMRPDAEVAVGQFLVGRVPNLDALAKEEIEKFRVEVKQTLETIKANLSPSAGAPTESVPPVSTGDSIP